MQKQLLETLIEKFYLNGKIEKIKLSIKDKKLNTKFIPTEITGLVGDISCDIDMGDMDIHIYETSQFIKLIKIFDKELDIQYNTAKGKPLLLILDKKYSLEFHLAESHLIPKVPKISEPSSYEIEIRLDNEKMSTFINAKKALGDIKKFIVEANQLKQNQATFEISQGTSFSDIIRFDLPTDSLSELKPIPFPIELFTDILSANKSSTDGTLYISSQGILKVVFKENGIESTYFLVRLEE